MSLRGGTSKRAHGIGAAFLAGCLALTPLSHAQSSGPSARETVASAPAGWQWIRPGRFDMGCVPTDRECHANETPRHPVVLTRGFFIMRTEVTVGLFSEYGPKAGVKLPRQPFWSDGVERPVVNVTWGEARQFCIRAFNGKLPTEAEWEYAARGGAVDATFFWGSIFDKSLVNGLGRRGNDRWVYAAPVASFAPNNRGLFDVLGNVWEWTADRYQRAYFVRSPREDPQGPASGDLRAVRGGSWDSAPRQLRLSVRTGLSEVGRHTLYVGFRCAADGPAAPPSLPDIPRPATRKAPQP